MSRSHVEIRSISKEYVKLRSKLTSFGLQIYNTTFAPPIYRGYVQTGHKHKPAEVITREHVKWSLFQILPPQNTLATFLPSYRLLAKKMGHNVILCENSTSPLNSLSGLSAGACDSEVWCEWCDTKYWNVKRMVKNAVRESFVAALVELKVNLLNSMSFI